MKKVALFVAVAALSAGTLVSCGKSSKGKMDGEWNVDSMSMTSSSTSGSSTSSNSTKIEGTTITMVNTSGSNSVTTTGTVNSAVWNINKDGSWDREISYTITQSGASTKTTMKSSGKWDFAAGVGEFKKNERVVFSTTSETSTEVTTSGSFTATETSTDTYADGEMSEVFVITESKKKNLEMSASGSGNSSYSSPGISGTSSHTSETTVKMTLK